MNNAARNTFLAVIALAVVSLSARNFSGAATTTSTAPARHYYLTKAVVNGDKALTSCASGYHFASYAELLDPAVLTYNKSLGRSAADDGAGPPANAFGWVRTGYASSSVPNGPGVPTNCSLWTSGSASDDGEVGAFIPGFEANTSTSTFVPSVVFANNGACDNSQGLNFGVWCVEN
jgi:hypothetical protein